MASFRWNWNATLHVACHGMLYLPGRTTPVCLPPGQSSNPRLAWLIGTGFVEELFSCWLGFLLLPSYWTIHTLRCSWTLPGFSHCLGPTRLDLPAASALRPRRTWTSTYVDSLDIGLERFRPSIWLRCCLLRNRPQLQRRRVGFLTAAGSLWKRLLTSNLDSWNSRRRRI